MQAPEPRLELDAELHQLAARRVPGILICLDAGCSYLNPLGAADCQRCGRPLHSPLPITELKERVH